jgi:phosphate ABC transporter phosphate-binding protein
MGRLSSKRAWGVLLALGLGCLGCSSGPRLDGAGSSFIDPLMQEWSNLYASKKSVKVNYQSRGSGAGIEMMTDKKVAFGCTDAPLTEEQLARCKTVGGDVLHVPLVMGAVVPAYNLPGNPELRFSGPVLVDIYLGKIKRWDEEPLKDLNPDVQLPALDIAVVHRSDSSGSSYIWTDYLNKVSERTWPNDKNAGWKKVGVGTAVQWPCGVGAKGNEGVAGQVQRAEGSIGYVELLYALQNKIPYGEVQNREKKFIKATTKSVTAAAASLEKIPDDLRYSLTDAPGEEAYPISGTTWAVLYAQQPAGRAGLVTDFLRWVTHEGQTNAEELHYAPLPEAIVRRVEEKLGKVHE